MHLRHRHALDDADLHGCRQRLRVFGSARFLYYNIPRGRRVLTGAEYRELARRHPSLAAVKFSSSDRP